MIRFVVVCTERLPVRPVPAEGLPSIDHIVSPTRKVLTRRLTEVLPGSLFPDFCTLRPIRAGPGRERPRETGPVRLVYKGAPRPRAVAFDPGNPMSTPLVLSALLLTAGLPSSQEARTAAPADLIVSGRVFTADPERPWAEAVAVSGERIAAVGTHEEIERLRGADTRVVDGGTRAVVPGFNDAHCHFTVGFGFRPDVDLTEASTLAEILAAVAAYAVANPDDEVIDGGQWDLADMPGHAFPTARMLDEVVPDRPVVLWSDGPHGVWVNSAALERARIDKDTRVPPATVFLRDETGEPSGVFLGRGLLGLFRFVPLEDFGAIQDGIVHGLDEARRLGVTSVHESVSSFVLPFLAELHDAGELTLRVHVWGGLTRSPFGGGPAEHLRMAKAHGREDWITFGTLKGGVDGMPGLRTAALLEPYADDSSTSGLTSMEPDQLAAAVEAANAQGLRVAIHATGDRGVRMALDAIVAAGKPELRNRIEHAFIVAPEDFERAAQAGVVVSAQPAFLAVDLAKDRFYEHRLGPARVAETMPFRSLLDAGATLAFGTDFSLTPLDPMIGIYAAVARRDLGGEPGAGWIPSERITVEEAVRAYTLGSAVAEGAADVKGTLTAGKLADIVVLSEDIFALDPGALPEVQVDCTIVGGEVVYRR